jgi:zinc protease
VVVEEWRGRLGAGTRIQQQQLPVLYNGSRYALRLPIGKPEIIRAAPAARLRAFYDTWYRPERIAIVAVGDVDPQEIESGIRAAFGGLRDRAAAAAVPDSSIPLHREPLVNVAADPEVTQSSVQLTRKRPREGAQLVGDYRRSVVENVFEQMFNDRFGELARKADAPFLSAGSGGGDLSPTVSTFSLSARVQDGKLQGGLTALEIEARRVRQFGFTASELDRAKRWVAAFYERAYSERDKTESSSFAQEYLNYFLEDEPTPGIAYEYQLVQRLLPTITLADITSLARSRLEGDGQVVLAVMPQKQDLPVPAATELQGALASAERAEITPWSDATTTKAWMEHLPEPAAVKSRRQIAEVGVTVVTFANGLEAWLKPTDFKNDQVLFTMYAPGGAALSGCDEFLQARFAPQYVGLSGAGGFKALDLQKLLAGKLASASPFISLSTHGISGTASPADLETALQLLYANVTEPGDDPDAFALMKRQLDAAVANRGRSPGQVFGEKLAEVNTSAHCTSQPLTAERVATLDRPRMMKIYRDRFANAADFTLFVVGAFDVEKTVPLLARYAGTLPSTGTRTAQFKDAGIRFPTSIVRAKIEKGREPRAQTVVSFFADPPFDPAEQEKISAASTVLETVLRDLLREELGQTYTVSVGLSQSPPQHGDGYIGVNFGAAPENIDAMTTRVIEEVKRLQADGPPADLVAKAKEAARRDYETALRQNGYWMRRLQTIHLLGGNPTDVITRNQRIEAVTPSAVQEVFRKYFPLDRYTVVTLVPEPAQ